MGPKRRSRDDKDCHRPASDRPRGKAAGAGGRSLGRRVSAGRTAGHPVSARGARKHRYLRRRRRQRAEAPRPASPAPPSGNSADGRAAGAAGAEVRRLDHDAVRGVLRRVPPAAGCDSVGGRRRQFAAAAPAAGSAAESVDVSAALLAAAIPVAAAPAAPTAAAPAAAPTAAASAPAGQTARDARTGDCGFRAARCRACGIGGMEAPQEDSPRGSAGRVVLSFSHD